MFVIKLFCFDFADSRTLLKTILRDHVAGTNGAEEIGEEYHMGVNIRLSFCVETRIVKVVKCHTRIAFNGFHGQLVHDISLVGKDIGLSF